MYDDSLIKDVLAHADIVDIISRYIDVKQKGRSYVALCPFHDDSSPSLQISKEKQIFKCFVCNTGGTAIKFVQEYEHISFMDALRKVAELSGYEDDRLKAISKKTKTVDPETESLVSCINDLTTYYSYALNTMEGQEGYNYFLERGLDDVLQKQFKLGYAFNDGKATIDFLQNKGHSLKTCELIGICNNSSTIYKDKNAGRVIFPLCDKNGQVIGFSARRLKNDGSAKYVNSPETKLFHKSEVLYNYHIAKEEAKREGYVYVLEGFMDVFALFRIGIKSAVATMGTALTKDHIKMLRSLGVEIRFCLDGDKPGQMAQMKIIELLKNENIPHLFVNNAGNTKDPDEILKEDGPDALRERLNTLITPLDFMINYYRETSALSSIQDKRKLIQYVLPVLSKIDSRLILSDYILKLSKLTGFDAKSISNLVENFGKKANPKDQSKVFNAWHPERGPVRRFALAEKEILYYMLSNPEAIEFYEDKIEKFYDTVYREIAEYIMDYYDQTKTIDLTGLLASIEAKEDINNAEIINTITDISYDTTHPKCTPERLEAVLETINKEKKELHAKSMLNSLLKNKSELEKAKILNDYTKIKTYK